MAMTPVAIRQQVKINQWKNLIMECRNSGIPVRQFCGEHNLSWHAYYYWLRKIREQLAANLTQEDDEAEPAFVRLPVSTSSEQALPATVITLRKGGFAVDISGDVNKGTLRSIIQLLNEEAL